MGFVNLTKTIRKNDLISRKQGTCAEKNNTQKLGVNQQH